MEIASVSTGKWDANHATEGGNYRFYTCAYDYLYCDTKRFEGECLILPGNGVNVGEVFYYNGEFDAYQRTYVISDIKILPKYLHYHMLLHWRALGTKQQYGSATNFIKTGNFKEYEVQYPPLPEQQRLVSILDEAFAVIERSRNAAIKNLKNAKELFESQLQLTMDNGKLKIGDGWEEKKLGEVIEYDKNQNIHIGLPYVGLEHIESNSGRFIGSLEPQVVKSSTFYFNEQHVLYGRLRPYLNKVLLPEFEGHCSTEIFPIKVGKQIAKEFLFYWLIAGSTVKKIDATWTGVRMPRANMNQVLEFDFAFPPLKEQQTIVRQLDALRAETQKLEAVYQKKLDDLEELKKSILQKAFAGELPDLLAGLKIEKAFTV